MSDELFKRAGELVVAAAAEVDASLIIAQAGGYITREGGKIVLGEVIRPAVKAMFDRLSKAKAGQKVPPDFESQPHGAKLLQEALNALLDGHDETKAEAILNVFLSLAQTTPRSAVEQMLQLDIPKATTDLTYWQVFALNLIERFIRKHRNPIVADAYSRADRDEQQKIFEGLAKEMKWEDWLSTQLPDDGISRPAVHTAIRKLEQMGIVRSPSSDTKEWHRLVATTERGVLTSFGRELVTHLYSADASCSEPIVTENA